MNLYLHAYHVGLARMIQVGTPQSYEEFASSPSPRRPMLATQRLRDALTTQMNLVQHVLFGDQIDKLPKEYKSFVTISK
jgi:hypothetical protein